MQIKYLWACLILLAGQPFRAFAQASAVGGEVDLDMRAYVTPQNTATSELYNVSLLLNGDLGKGYQAEVSGDRAYGHALLQEAAVTKDGGRVGAFAVGMIRIPFGIYDTSETYESGLIEYPIVRGDYERESVNWGVPGAVWTGGTAAVQVQAAAFDGSASGTWGEQEWAGGGAERVQLYDGSLIVGVSRWDGYLSPDSLYSDRQVVQITGVDWRYTRPHLLIRGEFIAGDLAGDGMHGMYSDIYYHVPNYAPLTLVARLEELHPSESVIPNRQITAGFRYIISPGWNFSANWITNNGPPYWETWTRSATGCRFEFQLYHVIEF